MAAGVLFGLDGIVKALGKRTQRRTLSDRTILWAVSRWT